MMKAFFFLKISLKTFMKTMEELGLLIKDIKLAKIINWKNIGRNSNANRGQRRWGHLETVEQSIPESPPLAPVLLPAVHRTREKRSCSSDTFFS